MENTIDAKDLPRGEWRISSHSGGSGNCVEVNPGNHQFVAVRDSKDRGRPLLIVRAAQWKEFTYQIKNEKLDVRPSR